MEQRQPTAPYYSAEEYLALEIQSEIRHEYYQGELYAMAGATLPHNRIVGNGYRALGDQLSPSQCEVFIDGALLKVSDAYYFYPDLIVSCDAQDLEAERILQYPTVLVEVLSPGSADYDRTTKLRLYQQLPSLQHYVLIRQDYCWVECLTRTPNDEWTLSIYDDLTTALHLPALSIRVPLAELYARVKLAEPPQAPEKDY